MRALGTSAATMPIGSVAPAAVKPSARIRKLRRGVINLSSDILAHAPLLPVLRSDLLVQAVCIADAGFGAIELQLAPITGRPSGRYVQRGQPLKGRRTVVQAVSD